MPRNKHTKPLAGPALKKYLRDLVDAETDAGADPGRKLVDTLAREIAEARVRMPIPVRRRLIAAPRPDDRPGAADVSAAAQSSPSAESTAPHPVQLVPAIQPVTPDIAPEAAARTTDDFDPYAFSVVAVLTKKGRDALLQRLAVIDQESQLRRIAEVQHLAIPPGSHSLEALRLALITGAEKRIADRRAAAS